VAAHLLIFRALLEMPGRLIAGTTGGTVTSSSGLVIVPVCTIFDPSPDFDMVIMPGGHGILDAYDNPALSAWLNTGAIGGSWRSATAFPLGSAGLIDNRRNVSRLAATFPKASPCPPPPQPLKAGALNRGIGSVVAVARSLSDTLTLATRNEPSRFRPPATINPHSATGDIDDMVAARRN
jgi:hypothetical protein